MKVAIIMHSLINKMFFYGKTILHIIVFCLVLYIMLMMQDYYKDKILTLITTFIPMLLVLSVFIISFFFDKGNKNVFFNIANFFALLSISLICFRTLFDKNMIMGIKENINYYYFQNQLVQIKILSYMIFLGNGCLLYQEFVNKKNKENIR